MFESGSFISNGNIPAARFCIMDRSQEGRVIVSNATTIMPCGISELGANAPNYGSLASSFVAVAGEPVRLHTNNQHPVLLTLNANCTVGDFLGPVNGGNGTPVTANASIYGAVALQSGLAGDLVRVRIQFGVIGGA